MSKETIKIKIIIIIIVIIIIIFVDIQVFYQYTAFGILVFKLKYLRFSPFFDKLNYSL